MPTSGTSVTVAVPFFVGSAALVAITVTVCRLRISNGGVYMPVEEMEPTAGLIDQLTAGFDVFETDAVNCCCPREFNVTTDGLTVTTIVKTCSEKLALEPF